MRKGTFTTAEAVTFNALEAKKAPIQTRLDELKAVIQGDDSTNKMVRDSRAEILETQKGLVPFSQMQAALASPISRDKYFPDLSKNDFIKHVESQIA